MVAKVMYGTCTGCSNLKEVTVSTSHGSSVATATVTCLNITANIGDSVVIDLGYADNHSVVFRGYVKQIEKSTPEGVYTVNISDNLVRAVDYFVASSDPDTPFKRDHIYAEDLIGEVLGLAGITNYTGDSSGFQIGINTEAEVNLISSYDYCRMISNIVAWEVYADPITGTVIFENRKPFVMDSSLSQPGDKTDVPIATLSGLDCLSMVYRVNEKDLRNRVVVYGVEGVHAEASSATSFDPRTGTNVQVLPDGFYKTAAAASEIIESNAVAQDAANYNLSLYNRLGIEMSLTLLGNPLLLARKVITFSDPTYGANYYIYSAEHSWSRDGYTTSLELRR